jgi:hypothetical protein
MSGETIFLIILAIIVLAALGGTVLSSMVRRLRLRKRFGPEYDKVVAEHESRREGEAELRLRKRRIQKLSLAELSTQDRERYWAQWTRVQEHFVEAPSEAVAEAQSLVEAVMRERGYPFADYEQTVADLSVEHARILDRFRSAHAISEKAAAGQVATEELRTAMLYYRELFDQLLATETTTADERQSEASTRGT